MAITFAVVGKFNDKDFKKAEASLAKLKKEALLAQSPMARLGTSMQETGKKMSKVGGQLTKYLTLPVGAIGAAAAASFMKVDEGLDTVAARSGETGKALEGLQTSFKTVAKTATQDMTTIGEVVGSLAGKLQLTGKPLENLSTRLLDLSRITGVDATSATDSVAKAIKGLGISSADTGKFLDELLVASQKSGIKVDELASQVAATAPSFKTMGIGTQDQIALLSTFAAAGLPATRMVSGLTTATANLAKKGVKDIPTALANVIGKIKSAGSESEATAIAVKTFGSRAGVAFGQAIRSGTLNINDMTKALDKSAGALDAAKKATDGPDEAIARLKNQFMLAGAAVATALLPAVERIVPVLSRVADIFTNLNPGLQTAIVAAGGFAFALGPVMKATGNVTSLLGKLLFSTAAQTTATGAATTAQTGLNTAMALNPIGIAVVAIGALVAGLVVAYKKIGWFHDAVDAVAHAVKVVFVGAFNVAKTVIGGVVSFISDHWRGLLQTILLMTGPLGIVITAVWKFHDQIGNAVGKVIDFFKSIPEKIKNLPAALGNLGKAMVEGLWNGISNMGGWLWGKIKEWAGSVIPGWMKKVLGISSPSKVTAAIGEDVARGMAFGIDAKAGDVKKAGSRIGKAAIEAAKAQAAKAKDVFDKLKSAANDALDKVKSRAQDVLDFAGNITMSVKGFGALSTFQPAEDQPTTAKDIIGNMASRLATIKKFGQQLQDLKALGLNNTSLQDIIAAGPDAGSQIAGALLKEGASAIGQVNGLELQLNDQATAIGAFGAQSQFGTSVADAQTIIESTIKVEAGAVVVQIGAGVNAADAASVRSEVAAAVQVAIDELGTKVVSEATKTVQQSLKSVKKAVKTSKASTRKGH